MASTILTKQALRCSFRSFILSFSFFGEGELPTGLARLHSRLAQKVDAFSAILISGSISRVGLITNREAARKADLHLQ
jgi:hypothetical protein